ncbi:MAG: HIT domain-containing protein [Patescibacteria group bacterium]
MTEKEVCVFCTKPDIREREISGDDLAWAFPTNIPIVPGHIIITSRRCVLKYENLTIEEKSSLEKLRVHIINALRKTFDAEGFNYAWNENEIAGQSVPHFHLHVVPRKVGDQGTLGYDPRKFLYRPASREATPEDELKEVCRIIKENL